MIEFKNVFKKYKNNTVLSNISFKIETGNIVLFNRREWLWKNYNFKDD